MWRFVVGTGTLTAAAIALMSTQAPTAHACSAGPDFDPVATSDVIVEGRMLSYELLRDNQDPRTGFVPVRVEMSVERVYKGDVAGPTIDVVDVRTYRLVRDEGSWGGGGSCGAFNSDPTGVYAILGLTPSEDGAFSSSLPRVLFLGEGPTGESYERALERMASFPGAAELPSLGSGPEGRDSGVPAAPVAVAIAGAALVASVGAIAFARRRAA